MPSYRSLILLILFTLAGCLSVRSMPAEAYTLSDTGQTKCYNNTEELLSCPSPGEPFYGQDAQYQGYQPAYQDNGDGTVTDLNTELIWQQNDDQNNIYRRWQEAADYCAGRELGGKTDWRLPTRLELLSIVDCGRAWLTINTTYFPECRPDDGYWSGTTVPLDPVGFPVDGAWAVHFGDGRTFWYFKDDSDYVRCVRGDLLPGGAYVENGDGTVTDTITGLMWQQSDDQNNAGGRTWEQALSYCEELLLAKKNDWRLPSILELLSLVDDSRNNLAINPVFSCRSDDAYWSATSLAEFPHYARNVNFFFGYDGSALGKDVPHYVRCVRGGLPAGTLKVIISPQGAIDAGAQWRLNGGNWQNSGDSLPDLVIGEHALEFKKIPGWVAPMTRTVTISTNQTTTITETYRLVKPLAPILLILD